VKIQKKEDIREERGRVKEIEIQNLEDRGFKWLQYI
jgi:hypothetical protein